MKSKSKRKQKIPKERNPFVQHLIGKKQGAHTKSKKAKRREDRSQLHKECFGKTVLLK
jgi:hypothetical protein